MTLATSNIYERVVKVETNGGLGTGTVIENDSDVFLLTAAHVVPDDTEPVKVSNRFRSIVDRLPRAAEFPPSLDLALFRLPPEFRLPDLPLPMSSAGCFYSQDVLFLGFPYGLALTSPAVGFLPFVKKAALSASDDLPDGKVWYLDGLNNVGFSGGPVVFAPPNQADVRLMGVISGYRPDWQDVDWQNADPTADGEEGGAGRVATNSGIVIAYDVTPVTDALETQ
jgi:hypothetical protein